MKRLQFSLLLLLIGVVMFAKTQIKVTCVGDGITSGYTLAQPDQESYPAQLQQLLGNKYIVGNFGSEETTLLKKGHHPYMAQEEFRKALAFAGDIVLIHLGINDTDPRDWPNYRDFFVQDYLALIDSFRVINPKCKVIISRLTPITNHHPRFESGVRDWHSEIQQAIETVATSAGVQLIDCHAPLYPYPLLLPDTMHPTKEGAAILAKTVYSAITGDYGGLKLSELYTDNMVLQRDQLLPVSGKANALEKVTVTIGKQKKTTRTGLDGNWTITLQPLSVGDSYTLTVTAGKKTLICQNVLVGEVWLCSGQSNMEFLLRNTTTAKTDVPLSENKNIRLFHKKARWATNSVEWEASVLDSLNRLQYYKDAQWNLCSPSTSGSFSAVAYYFGKMLQDSLQVPVGLICNAVGGSPTEAWVARSTLEYHFPAILHNWTQNDFIQSWVRERAALNVKKTNDKNQRHPYAPSYLFESSIQPLGQFPIKGVIWYQGESNAHNREAHEKLFKLLVESWRTNWKDKNMPFYYVQLSSIDRPSWTWFRDSQRKMMDEIPHTGMAVASDCGDSLDVHPRLKKQIGERLGCWALSKTYRMQQVVASGPLFKAVQFREGAAYLSFDYAEGMCTSDKQSLRTFEIAETEGIYYPATAKVIGDQIKVVSAKVRNPHYVRYGWQPFTRANLVNSAGLPASTFRTD